MARPDNEATRRAKLAARTARERAGHAVAGDLSGHSNTEDQATRPLLSAAGLRASGVVDEARHVALEESGDGLGRARAVLGDDDVGVLLE